MAGPSGIDADLSRAAGRGCNGHSMVIESSTVSLQDELPPMNQGQSSLARDLVARAATAMEEAHEMPSGDARSEAINRAMVFRNAAEIHRLLCGKRDAPPV